jgi:oligosaccharide repeat unit polymerase
MFFSDFLARGYDDKNISAIIDEEVYFYQLIILAALSVIYVVTYSLCKKRKGRPQLKLVNSVKYFFANRKNQKISNYFFWIAWLILALEVLKRLYFVDWSFNEFIITSFGSRHYRPWASSAGPLGDGKFLFALIGIIFPLSGLILSSSFLIFTRTRKYLSALGYIIVLLLLMGAGSRTPVVLLIAYPLFLYLKLSKSLAKQLVAFLITFILVFLSTSLIYNYRDKGFVSPNNLALSNQPAISQPAIVYNQDDSYYRAIRTIDIVYKTDERWDVLPFLGASLLNFIPRYFWPGKPILDENYWGSLKLYYVTITFIGESVALFGVSYGWLMSIFIGLTLFLFLHKLYIRIVNPYDFLLYILGAIYVYMVFRSLLNISQFIYAIVLFYILLKVSDFYMSEKTN